MDNLASRILMITLLLGCVSNREEEYLTNECYFEELATAKADWPGLFQARDSLVTIISIVDENRHISKNIAYQGDTDVFWTGVVERAKISALDDTVVTSFIAKPIRMDTTKVTLYFMSFDELTIGVKRNGEEVFDGEVQTFKTKVMLEKHGMKKIEVVIDNKSISLPIHNEYNYIELIKRDSSISSNYLFFSPI